MICLPTLNIHMVPPLGLMMNFVAGVTPPLQAPGLVKHPESRLEKWEGTE